MSDSTASPPPGREQLASRGVERGEELVRGIGVAAGQGVEQRGLAGVGVAHQGDRQDLGALARAPLHLALLLHRRELVLEHLDALAEQPAVGFQLRLARSAQADPALLPLQVGPAAHQPRGQMLELRQLDLQLALVAAGALREDVEDQADAIDDAAAQRLLEVALLGRGELVIEHHHRRALLSHRRRELGDLAAAGEGGRIGALALALHDSDDLQPGAQRRARAARPAWPDSRARRNPGSPERLARRPSDVQTSIGTSMTDAWPAQDRADRRCWRWIACACARAVTGMQDGRDGRVQAQLDAPAQLSEE